MPPRAGRCSGVPTVFASSASVPPTSTPRGPAAAPRSAAPPSASTRTLCGSNSVARSVSADAGSASAPDSAPANATVAAIGPNRVARPEPVGDRLVQHGHVAEADQHPGAGRPHRRPVEQVDDPRRPGPAAGADHRPGRRVAPGALQVAGALLVGARQVPPPLPHVRADDDLQPPGLEHRDAALQPLRHQGAARGHDRDPVAAGQPPGAVQRLAAVSVMRRAARPAGAAPGRSARAGGPTPSRRTAWGRG